MNLLNYYTYISYSESEVCSTYVGDPVSVCDPALHILLSSIHHLCSSIPGSQKFTNST